MDLIDNRLYKGPKLIATFYDGKTAKEVVEYYKRKEQMEKANKVLAEVVEQVEDYPFI